MKFSGKKILLAEDDEVVRFTEKEFFEDMGYEVIEAKNGKIAIERYHSESPDLVVTDLRMPELGGLGLIDAIYTDNRDIPIIVVSGTGILSDALQAINHGAWEYITKPIIDFSVFEYAINKVLERAQFIEQEKDRKKFLEVEVEKRTEELKSVNSRLRADVKQHALAENEIRDLNASLEKRVKERTKALEESLSNLQLTHEKLVESEKLAILDNLLAGIAHEVNTPIGIGVSLITLLSDQTKKIQKDYAAGDMTQSAFEKYLKSARKTTDIVYSHLRKATRLISSFKEIAVDQSSMQKRKFNLKSYLHSIVVSLDPETKKMDLAVKIDCPEDYEIDSYPGVYSQIFTNLIMNSLIHGFSGIDKGQIDIEVKPGDKQLSIIYRDSGGGMKPEVVTNIFEPFYTTKIGSGGSGLGMNIVYNSIKVRLGGRISCSSSLGKGVEFNMIINH